MPQQKFTRLWAETVAARPDSRDSFKSMHLHNMHQATKQQANEQVCLMHIHLDDFVLFEWKGNPKNLSPVQLPAKDGGILWLNFQLQGKTVFPDGSVVKSDSFFAFQMRVADAPLTLSAEKQWCLLFGIHGVSKFRLLNEFPILRELLDRDSSTFPSMLISYQERQCLDLLSKTGFGSFSLSHHIGQLLGRLYANYAKLLQHTSADVTQIQLYNRALRYIQSHYLDAGLSREVIAGALNCSVRSLTRVFEGKSLSINATIMGIRLQKGRELLVTQPDLSIERIALQLHFFDAKHFSGQYKKRFHRSPREERKEIALPKKV